MPVRELYEWTCECCGVVVTLEGGAINHWPEGWGTVEVEHRNERLGRLTHLSVCGDCLKTVADLLRGWRRVRYDEKSAECLSDASSPLVSPDEHRLQALSSNPRHQVPTTRR